MIKDLIVKRKSYKNKKGEEKTDVQFYLVLDNGNNIRISPYVSNIEGHEWNTFRELLLIAHEQEKESK